MDELPIEPTEVATSAPLPPEVPPKPRPSALVKHPDRTIAWLLLLSLALWVAGDRVLEGPGATFFSYGTSGVSWYVVMALFVAWVAARASNPKVPYREALLPVAAFAPLAVVISFIASVTESDSAYRACQLGVLAGGVLALAWGLRRVTGRYQLLSAFLSAIAIAVFLFASDELYVRPYAWYAEEPEQEEPEAEASIDAEALLFGQAEKVDRAIGRLGSREQGRANMFFLGFAGYGDEKVFAHEINTAASVVGMRYDSLSRSLRLVNDRRNLEVYPLATVTGLRRMLQALGARMDREQDVLFIALSSHGNEDGNLAVVNGRLPLQDLTPDALGDALSDAGIRWKVVVVSACYSGAFIEPLKDEQTIVLTAAAPDRTSFGCSDKRELTYFGEAFFRDALPTAGSLREAFETAKASIGERERAEGIQASNPQAHFGVALERHLASLEAARVDGPR